MGVPQSTQIPNSPLSSLVTASAMSCSRARDWSSRVAAWERSKARVAPSGSCSSSLLSPSRAAETSSMPLDREAMRRCASSLSAATSSRIRSSSTMSGLQRFGGLEPAHLEFVEFVLESVQCAREFGQALEVRLVVGGHLLVLVGDLRIQLVHSSFDRGQFLL